MKISKKLLSILLCMLMLAGIMPVGAFADERNNVDAETDAVFDSQNAFGLIANNLENANEDEDYVVSNVTLSGKTATVDFTNAEPCKLVVAIYDENTLQMLGSGMKDVGTEHIGETVEINISSMPEKFVVKAFLLDSRYAALSNQYTSYEYTSKYEDFLEKEPEDFSDNEIIVFDKEKEHTDFAVLTDGAISGDNNSKMSFSYDEASSTYTFTNATEEVKALKAGDVYYQEGEGTTDFLLFKVLSVSVSGNTVTVKEDVDVDIDEIFQFIRIDSFADYSDMTEDDIELGDGFTLTGIDNDNLKTQAEIDVDDSMSGSISATFKYTLYSNGTEDASGKTNDDEFVNAAVSLNFKYSWSIDVKMIYDIVAFGSDYYEFRTETKQTIDLGNVTVVGTVKLPDKFCKVKIPVATVGPFSVNLSFKFVLEVSAAVTISHITWESKQTISKDSDNGLKKTVEKKKEWKDPEMDNSLSIKIGGEVGLKLTLTGLNKKWEDRINCGFTIGLGITITADLNTIDAWTDVHHDCKICLEGDIKFYFNGTVSLNLILVKNKLDFSVKADIWKYEHLICDFYLNETGFHEGTCPNYSYKVTVNVQAIKDTQCIPVAYATVSASDGVCDNEKDEQWDDHTTLTDENGKAVFYFKTGEHSITVSHDDYVSNYVQNFKIISNAKIVTVLWNLTPEEPDTPDTPTDPTNPGSSDGTGSDDGWADSTHIRFGSYPQTDVTASMGKTLDAKATGWKSYKYYEGTDSYGTMHESDYMMYCDVKYGGNKYRGVKFNTYRPYCTEYASTSSASSCGTYQDDNGYTIGNTYWFRYEPLVWRVLGTEDGGTIVMSENIIDSQAFNNYILFADGKYWADSCKTNYASNYSRSSLRDWLINDFYSTAFSSTQQSKIITRECDNSCYSSSYPEYNSNPLKTNDKIFLLSYAEATSGKFGFNGSWSNDVSRIAQGTDYAKCQGLHISLSENESSCWWLRSPKNDSYKVCQISWDGNGTGNYNSLCTTSEGVRPAIKLDLASLSTQSADSSISTQSIDKGAFCRYSCSDCIPGNEYILMQVAGYKEGFTLTTSNLEYIDQLSSDESGTVSGVFAPRRFRTGNTTLLIGDFGSGIEARTLDIGLAINGNPKIAITSYVKELSVDYRSTLTFHADAEDLPYGTKICWIVSDGNDYQQYVCDELVLRNVNESFVVCAMIILEDDENFGNSYEAAQSELEVVRVKTSFFAKLIAFFKGLFGSLPKYVDNKRV